jgi:hypothetical protein
VREGWDAIEWGVGWVGAATRGAGAGVFPCAPPVVGGGGDECS